MPKTSRPGATQIHPPYGEIGDLLRAGRVVPVLGAGASAVGRPASLKWQWQPTGKVPPTGADLARFLAQKAEFPSRAEHERSDLPRVSSYFVETVSRMRLRERLREVLAGPYQPGLVHEFLARVPGRHLFVVTNYDTLLERAFRFARVPFDLVYYPTDRPDAAASLMWWKHGESRPREVVPNELVVDTILKRRTVIYKMHGTIFETPGAAAADARAAAQDSFVITEEDYVEFLSRMTKDNAMPPSFKAHFSDRSFLFLGYSLRDWNFRLLLGDLNLSRTSRGVGPGRSSPIRSWAIQFQPSELERKLWASRGIDIYDRDLADFVARMTAVIWPSRSRKSRA